MKITVEGTPNEMATVVLAIQSQSDMPNDIQYNFISVGKPNNPKEINMEKMVQTALQSQEIAEAEKRCMEIAKSVMRHRV